VLVRAEGLQARHSPDSNDVITEADESPLLETVSKERLVKTQQSGKDLSGAVVISGLWRLSMTM
jgi:hypothetical protein